MKMVTAPSMTQSKQKGLVMGLQKALKSILGNCPVKLAYLYGSTVSGKVTPFSDVDIALVVDEGLTPLEQLKLMLKVQIDLADYSNIHNTDVRVINDAPVVFKGRIVCDGVLLYVRDERTRVEFETATRGEYFDYLPVHRRLQEAFFAEVRERGLYSGLGSGLHI